MTHAAFRATVTLGEQIAFATHPEVIPDVRAAVPVVCAVANSTNVSPGQIVAALEAAGITNKMAVVVINGSLSLLNVVISASGTNTSAMRAYAVDMCEGMQAGLPGRAFATHLPPHLR